MTLTVQQLRASIEADIQKNEQRQDSLAREMKAILANAEQSGRTATDSREDALLTSLYRDIEHCKAANRRNYARLERVVAAEDEENESERRLEVLHDTRPVRNAPHYDEAVRVTRESRTYNPESDPDGKLFLSDLAKDAVYNGRDHDGASERISRHAREERVERPGLMERTQSGVGTSAFVGLTVPQYLVDMVAPKVANLRPVANIANKHILPPNGMSLNESRITTSSSAALQSSQLGTVSFTDMDDTLLTINVNTAAGQQVVSRQALERAGVGDTVMEDLFRQIATCVDSTMLNQATYGALNTASDINYTDATPTYDELYPYLWKAQSTLEKVLLGVARVDYAVMRTDRWNWFASQLSTSHPTVAVNGGTLQNAVTFNNDYLSPVRGRLSNGLAVVTDNNIPNNLGTGTDEDRIILMASNECHLWEDSGSPIMIRAEATADSSGTPISKLGIVMVAYEYFAYTWQRYTGNPAMISDTGLIVTTALADF